MEIARAHGCHHVIDYRREDFVASVNEFTLGRGVENPTTSACRAAWAVSETSAAGAPGISAVVRETSLIVARTELVPFLPARPVRPLRCV